MKIKHKNILFVIIGLIVLSSAVFFTDRALAVSCGGVETSVISCDQTGSDNSDISNSGIWGILLLAINILTAGVGIAAVGGLIYGSILYTSAGGTPEGVKKAHTIIQNVVIGIVMYALLYSLLNFLIPGGIFN